MAFIYLTNIIFPTLYLMQIFLPEKVGRKIAFKFESELEFIKHYVLLWKVFNVL